MGWDEICIICGISPSGAPNRSGPCWLLTLYYEGWQAEQFLEITFEIVSINGSDFGETFDIVSEALSLPIYENDETIERLREVRPGLGDWSGFKRYMAIGQFPQPDGEAIYVRESGSCKIPDGRQVEVRLVDGYDGGSFIRVLMENQLGGMTEKYSYSHCSAYVDSVNPNLSVSEGCYHYLHARIDWAALPPRKQATLHHFLLAPNCTR
jgi:hypothetical protein